MEATVFKQCVMLFSKNFKVYTGRFTLKMETAVYAKTFAQ